MVVGWYEDEMNRWMDFDSLFFYSFGVRNWLLDGLIGEVC
jgi:hypothetical protein